MSQYQQLLEKLKADRCPGCTGQGTCNDAGFGDITYNTWTCRKCDGTGLKSKGKDWEVEHST